MTRNARWIVAAVAVACLLASGCGEGADVQPIRIAVLSDCVGAFGFAHELTIAGAELPLLDRGGTLAASAPSAGVEGAEVAGRPVELQVACLSGQQNDDTLEARRVVELGDADVVIGPILGASGLVYRSYAKRHPDVTFVSGTGANPSTTLREPASNLYRFMTDGRQWSAGLGSYAYHELGWRKAAVVNEDYGFGWAQAGGFVAEFCSLGGTVVRASPRLGTADLGPTIATLSRARVDGLYLASSAAWLVTLANEMPQLKGALADKLVAGVVPLQDPGVFDTLGKRLEGVVWAPGPMSTGPGGPAWDRYAARFAEAFPSLPPGCEACLFAVGYYNAMDAVVQALEQADGDLSGGQRRFRAALAQVALDAPNGRIRLDANRQAIGPNYLSRIERDVKGNLSFAPFRTIPNVDQSLGGLIRTGSPPSGPTQPPCKKGNPPPWARR